MRCFQAVHACQLATLHDALMQALLRMALRRHIPHESLRRRAPVTCKARTPHRLRRTAPLQQRNAAGGDQRSGPAGRTGSGVAAQELRTWTQFCSPAAASSARATSTAPASTSAADVSAANGADAGPPALGRVTVGASGSQVTRAGVCARRRRRRAGRGRARGRGDAPAGIVVDMGNQAAVPLCCRTVHKLAHHTA